MPPALASSSSPPGEAPAVDQITPFRFEDLLPELRNRVYSIHLRDITSDGVNLAKFKPPPISQVSKQLRAESLPVFFAECEFHVNVGANLDDYSHARFRRLEGGARNPAREQQHRGNVWKSSGVLNIKQPVRKFITSLGENALVRNITLRIHETRTVRPEYRQLPTWPEALVAARTTLTVDQKSLQVVEEFCSMKTSYTAGGPSGTVGWKTTIFETCDVQDGLDLARKEAEDIAGRDGFKGFTLADLQKIAHAFRLPYWNE